MNQRRNTLLSTTGLTPLLTPVGHFLGAETRMLSQDIVSYQVGFWARQRAIDEAHRRSLELPEDPK